MATRRTIHDHDESAPAQQIGPKCRRCERGTPQAILAQHGGWCVPCFDAYCASPDPHPVYGQAGYVDTSTQRAMRKDLRPMGTRRRNVLADVALPIAAEPAVDFDSAKAETERKLAAYYRQNPHLRPQTPQS